MKCPKCGYVSFDHNLTCPKCDKDISWEQEKLHMPAFRPDPPALLVALTGEVNDTHGSIRSPSAIPLESAEVIFDEESSHFDSREMALPESGDFELGSEEISLADTSGLSLGTGETAARGKSGADGISGTDLDTEDAIAELDLGSSVDEEVGPDTLELELEKSGGGSEGDELSLDFEEGPEDESSLDLDSSEELDRLLDMDEISLEEIPLETKPEKGKGKGAKAEDDDLSLDLEDLDLEFDLEDGKPH
jgi:hypothetical protein